MKRETTFGTGACTMTVEHPPYEPERACFMTAPPTPHEAFRGSLARVLGVRAEDVAHLEDDMLLTMASARINTRGAR
jgi:hypothetical protein